MQTEEYQEMLEMNEIAEQESNAYIEEISRDYEVLNEYDYEKVMKNFLLNKKINIYLVVIHHYKHKLHQV